MYVQLIYSGVCDFMYTITYSLFEIKLSCTSLHSLFSYMTIETLRHSWLMECFENEPRRFIPNLGGVHTYMRKEAIIGGQRNVEIMYKTS